MALVVKNPPANEGDARDMVSIPRMGGSPGVGNGNLLQYSCLENSMERGAWRAKELNTAEHAEHTTSKQTNKKTTGGGLPWWCGGQESACQCRGHRFHPWTVMILHATEQLSSCAATTEPVLHNKRSHLNEKPKHHSEKSPTHHNRRKPTCKATKTQNYPPKKPQN